MKDGEGGAMTLRLVRPNEKPVDADEALRDLSEALNRYVELGCPGRIPPAGNRAVEVLARSIDGVLAQG